MLEHFLDEGKGWIENQIDACLHLSDCYQEKKKAEASPAGLISQFYFLTSHELRFVVKSGIFSFHEEKYLLAAFWYERALRCKRNDKSGGFVSQIATTISLICSSVYVTTGWEIQP